jgi:uncharacterized protein (DUF2336 family)
VSSSDFRQITIKGEAKRADRLFRAAISAFCSLTRPTRREIAQVEDLTLPLFDQVSVASKRYVSAALSECPYPPPALVQRLADESVDIAAPLLIRSSALSDADLVKLISRHGLQHAQVIGRRPGLNKSIAKLVEALESKIVPLRHGISDGTVPAASPLDQGDHHTAAQTSSATGGVAETLRRLQAMMQPSAVRTTGYDGETAYDRLRETVLSGRPRLFQTTLANALGADYPAVVDASTDASYAWLIDALRVLDLEDEKAFLLVSAVYPSLFGSLTAIRLFLLRYAAVSRHEARQRIAEWQPRLRTSPAGSVSHIRVAG